MIIVSRALGLISAAVALLVLRIRWPRTRWLRLKRVGTFYSQHGQDLYVASLLFNALQQQQGPWVVDVGCNHPTMFSNSLLFEKYFGCRTLAIDALASYQADWETHRPTAHFLHSAIGAREGTVRLTITGSDITEQMFSFVEGGKPKDAGLHRQKVVTVPVRRLQDVLAERGIRQVLFMSIDVEGAELDVLKGTDFDQCFIACLCVENNSRLSGEDEIRHYLLKQGYMFHSRIGFLDDVFVHGGLLNGQLPAPAQDR